jgi:hypothetical protein
VISAVSVRSVPGPTQEPAVPFHATTSTSAVRSNSAAATMGRTSNCRSELPSRAMRVTSRVTSIWVKCTVTSVRSPSIRYVCGSRRVLDEGTIMPILVGRAAIIALRRTAPHLGPPGRRVREGRSRRRPSAGGLTVRIPGAKFHVSKCSFRDTGKVAP